MEKKTSIIIVTYNALDYVEKCLESIAKHTSDIHEVVVVDNASEPELREYLTYFSEKVRKLNLIFNDKNTLWSPGNNIGLKAAAPDSEYLMLLNSDTEVFDKQWIEKLQSPFGKYRNCGITGIQFNYLPIGPMFGAIDGCNFMISRSLFNQLGTLNEDFPWNGAGFEYSVKAWKAGFYPVQINEPILIHYGKRSRVSNQTMLHNQKVDTYGLMKKHGLKPNYSILSLVQYKLGIFSINKKLKKRLS